VDRLTVPYPRWRAQSVKAYGNSMVPQVMFEIFRAIADVYGYWQNNEKDK
jgi:DNA (cytosine-5)-methyltransferase 1